MPENSEGETGAEITKTKRKGFWVAKVETRKWKSEGVLCVCVSLFRFYRRIISFILFYIFERLGFSGVPELGPILNAGLIRVRVQWSLNMGWVFLDQFSDWARTNQALSAALLLAFWV